MADRFGSNAQGFERFEDDGAHVQSVYRDEGDGTYTRVVRARLEVWSSSLLQWVRWDGSGGGGGGGGGGAVTVADGADVAQGATTDASGSNTVIGKLKQLVSLLSGTLTVGGTVTVANPTANPETGLAKDATLTGGSQIAKSRGQLWTGSAWADAPGDATSGAKVQSAQLPAALAANGGLKIEGVAGGVAVPISAASLPTHGVTVADGGDAAQGTTTDASTSNTVIGLLKAIKAALTGTLATSRTWSLASGSDSVAIADGGGTITVDAPIANPVWVRLSDGAAAFIGQKAMAASIPVVIASDQSSLPTTEARLPSALVGGRLDVNIGAAGAAVPVTDNAGSLTIDSADLGTTADAEATGNGSLIAIAKRLRTLFGGGLPAALATSGALKVDQQSALPAGSNTIGKVDQGAAGAALWKVDASGAAVPVTDNAGSLTVDAPVGTPVFVRLSDGGAALVGQKVMAASVPVVIASDQGAVPDNLSQIGGTALAAKTVPANADGQVAIPVYVNAQQYATYDVAARNIATGALTANTAKAVLSLEHALASTKTVRIRRIMVHMLQTTALSGAVDVQITRGTAASSAGSAVTPQQRRLTDPAAECVVKSLPTITAATVADNIPAGGFATTTTLYSPPVLIYDWQEAGETKPYLLVAGALQSLVVNVISTAAHNLTLTISIDFTEE